MDRLGAAEVVEVEAVDRRFLASATAPVPVAAEERELIEEGRGATEFGVRDVVEESRGAADELLVELAGFLAAAVPVPRVEVLLSLLGEAALLLGTVEVRRAVLLDSSSEADTLGRERWVAVEEVLAGLRTVLLAVLELLPGGRVGGLVRPPATREVVEEVVLAGFPVLEVDVVGRRAAAAVVPELEAGFFREEAVETVDFVLGEVVAVAAAAAGLGASSC